jgi:hypothetical protein
MASHWPTGPVGVTWLACDDIWRNQKAVMLDTSIEIPGITAIDDGWRIEGTRA